MTPSIRARDAEDEGWGGIAWTEGWSRHLFPIASLVICVAAWQLIVVVFRPPTYLLPAPYLVLEEMVLRFDYLIGHAWVTTLETIIGFVLSILVGMPLAIAIVISRVVEQSIYPLLVTSQAVPKVALAPLLLVWIGFGVETKIVVAVLIAFFPIVIGTVVGLKSVPTDMLDLGRSMGLSPLRLFLKISLPHALPSIFGGLKVAVTLAVVGAVVGEFVGADRGLGYLLLLASGQLQMPLMFAAIVFLVVIGVASFAAIQWLERLMLPWHVSVRRDAGLLA